MGSPVLSDARGLGDILDSGSYRFSLGAIPGYQADAMLEIQCTQAVYPGRQNEIFSVTYSGGHELSYRGRGIVPKTLSLTYAERVQMNVTKAFGTWMEYIVGMDSGNSSGYKVDYAIDGATLCVYDIKGVTRDTITFFGLQVSDRPDINFDSSSSGAVSCSISLTYDYYYSTLFGPSAGTSVSGSGGGIGGISTTG